MNAERLKRLPEIIKKSGFRYELIKRTDEKAIYAQNDLHGGIVAFEVWKIKKSAPHPRSEKDVENFDFVENFPSNESFGNTAWTYPSLALAEKRYDSIIS